MQEEKTISQELSEVIQLLIDRQPCLSHSEWEHIYSVLRRLKDCELTEPENLTKTP